MKQKFKVIKQHLFKNSSSQGFTLIELLVTVIIIGILTAIALPNFLKQTAKARQAEAINMIGTVNSRQTAYRLLNSRFANSFRDLALEQSTDTVNYRYVIEGSETFSAISAQAKNTAIKGYSGAAATYTNSSNKPTISSVICEAPTPGISTPNKPVPGGIPDCTTAGMNTVGR